MTSGAQRVKNSKGNYRGWHRKGYKFDKTSEIYKQYYERLVAARRERKRKLLLEKAKAPLDGRFKHIENINLRWKNKNKDLS